MAGVLQVMLLLGLVAPLLSFLFLALFGSRLGRSMSGPGAGHGPAEPAPTGQPLAGWIATGAIGFALLAALVALFGWAGGDADARAAWAEASSQGVLWTMVGDVPIRFAVRLDSLTLIVYLMVTLCATCIHVFSIGYMRGDSRFFWFFAYLSLFSFSMLGLVISSNLLFMFIFWELVGVCSYFLIGFWFEKRSASNAAIKAFVTNRVGDFGFMIGLGLCFFFLGDLSLDGAAAVFEAAARHAGWFEGTLSEPAATVAAPVVERASGLFTTEFLGIALATWLGIGLFCGAVGKSAQFPLHVWLPDAMEGPTPVSALIHAATMVAAGVYLVARVFLLLTPGAQMFIAVIGCITLTMAALLALVQTDIKRVLAYSTLSQLGYMIFALGIGAWIAALFHLLTHAFFKALLFLGAGQVIAGCHHEQDMRRMGGLWSRMPNTAGTFLIAVLAISGVGIPWTPLGIGGFYSKDEILAVAHYRCFGWDASAEPGGHATGSAGHARARPTGGADFQPVNRPGAADTPALRVRPVAFVQDSQPQGPIEEAVEIPVEEEHAALAAEAGEDRAYAAIYPGIRPLALVLFLLPVIVAYITPFYMGRCFVLTFLGKPRDEDLHEHAHESPIMYGPLIALAILTIGSGWFLFRRFVEYAAPAGGLPPLIPAIDGESHALHAAHMGLPVWVGFSWILGLGAAWLVYRDGFAVAERLRAHPVLRPIDAALRERLYIDQAYDAVLVMGTRGFAWVSRTFDNYVVDGLVNFTGLFTERFSRFTGVVLDQFTVDGLVNLIGATGWWLGGLLRTVQTGIVRNYILLAATGVVALIVWILAGGDGAWALTLVAAVLLVLLLPWSNLRRMVVGA